MDKKQQPRFLLFAKRKNSNDPYCNIYVRVTYLNNRHERSLAIKCLYDYWNAEEQRITNDSLANADLNQKLEEIRQKFMGAFWVLAKLGQDFSLQELVDMVDGERTPGSLSFCQCFNDVINRMQKMQGQDGSSIANLQKHKRCLEYFKSFSTENYKASDMPFSKITRSVIDELTTFILIDGACSHNTAMKYLQIIKKIYRVGIDNGWVRVNAFANFKFRIKPVTRECLNEEELQRIKEKEFQTPRLDYVRDIFVFSCYTGLAFIDIKNLKRKNIVEFRNRPWIKNRRTKTNVEASLPLLPAAKRILEKRNPHWFESQPDSVLFDVISNQKLNGYLKEIAEICKINKLLTFHIARHTFATTVTLMNGVPIESISKMLGHSRIIMTQHYSKVADLKIERDSELLFKE